MAETRRLQSFVFERTLHCRVDEMAFMRDLDKALADIVAIRTQIAAGTAFQGYGPAMIAATGGLALVTATAQWLWLGDVPEPLSFFAGWVATAVLAILLIGGEMLARSRRHHSGLADALLYNAVETFLPAGAAGALLGLVLMRFAPDLHWTLPGFWQLLISLGLFASIHALPQNVRWAAAWYFLAGLSTLAVAAEARTLSPWLMGLPFVVGQVLLAALLHAADGDEPHA